MADTRPKRRRSEEQMKKKKESDKERAKFRIYIGSEPFERWQELRRQKGFRSNIQVALFLLDRWETLNCWGVFSSKLTLMFAKPTQGYN